MLTWILGYFWSLPRGVSPRLEWGHARVLFSRAVAALSRFPLLGSRDVWLSLEAFPRGFPTRLSHRDVPRATVVRVDVRRESRSSAGKTVYSGLLYLLYRGRRPWLESGPEPEDSSPVLTSVLGYFWSLPRGVSPRLEWGHARGLFAREVAAT